MGNINVLDFHVANLIAAGEVVDRPSSVLKELMENAIDAGADRITVEVKRGGVEFIRVSDNGHGMSREDLPVSIKRHATSKIRSEKDLDGIATLGFRGEALAAISAVSKTRIMTRTANAEMGAVMESEGGRVIDISDAGCQKGTTVIVEELFANVPARRKFLKKDVTETAACAAVCEKIALSRPDIAISFIADGNMKFTTSGDSKLYNAIYSVLGRDFAKGLIEVHDMSAGIEIYGFIGTPENVRGNRNFENFFINGRFVKSKTATAALEQAYDSYISGDRFPACVLNINIHPAFVDVNVHPAKLEVKFSNERLIFETVYSALRNRLATSVSRPNLNVNQTQTDARRVAASFVPITDRSTGGANKNQTFFDAPSADYSKSTGSYNSPLPPYKSGYGTGNSPAKAGQTVPQAPPADSVRMLEIIKSVADEASNEDSGIPLPFDIPAPATRAQAASMQAASMPAEKAQEEPAPQTDARTPLPFYKILGSAFNAYIFVELNDKVMMIDKHAAHERINFENMKRNMKQGGYGQILLIPLKITLSPQEISAVCEYSDEIKATGFDFDIDGSTATILQIPQDFDAENALAAFSAIAGALADGTGNAAISREILCEKALYQAACKASLKAGREDTAENIDWLVREVLTNPEIKVCPHGRPIAFELTKKDIERQFKRT